MAKRSGPTLYEAMSKSAAGGVAARPSSSRRATTDSDRPAQPVLLTPGAAVRLPVGYIWVLGIAFIGLTVGAYFLGHSKGMEAGRRDLQQSITVAEEAAVATARLREPGDRGVSGSGGGGSEGSGPRDARAGTSASSPSRPPAADSSPRPSDVMVDRRQEGLHYYRLVLTNRTEAIKTAKVVSIEGESLGLDAQVAPGENGQFAVVLLPGFDPKTASDEELARWPQVIGQLASKVVGKIRFKDSERPFSDAFAKRYP